MSAKIPTSPADIDKLLERLYEEKRQLQAGGIANPTFVFFVRPEDRYEVERRILVYLNVHYLIDSKLLMSYAGASNKASYFHFPGSEAAIVLLEYL